MAQQSLQGYTTLSFECIKFLEFWRALAHHRNPWLLNGGMFVLTEAEHVFKGLEAKNSINFHCGLACTQPHWRQQWPLSMKAL